jgi:hypothetical protein
MPTTTLLEMAIKADYDPQTAVERELVLRLATLLWRLRRATAIESGLFDLHARDLLRVRQSGQANRSHMAIIESVARHVLTGGDGTDVDRHEPSGGNDVDASRPQLMNRPMNSTSRRAPLSLSELTNLPA